MSLNPLKGVVDPSFRVYGTLNVHVCDASVFPSSITVNPQLTVMALAAYAADEIAGPAPDRRGQLVDSSSQAVAARPRVVDAEGARCGRRCAGGGRGRRRARRCGRSCRAVTASRSRARVPPTAPVRRSRPPRPTAAESSRGHEVELRARAARALRVVEGLRLVDLRLEVREPLAVLRLRLGVEQRARPPPRRRGGPSARRSTLSVSRAGPRRRPARARGTPAPDGRAARQVAEALGVLQVERRGRRP